MEKQKTVAQHATQTGTYITWCFTPSQPVRLYQGKAQDLLRHAQYS